MLCGNTNAVERLMSGKCLKKLSCLDKTKAEDTCLNCEFCYVGPLTMEKSNILNSRFNDSNDSNFDASIIGAITGGLVAGGFFS